MGRGGGGGWSMFHKTKRLKPFRHIGCGVGGGGGGGGGDVPGPTPSL